MGFFVRKWTNYYQNLLAEYSDPRVNDWILMDSIYPIVIISLIYVYLVEKTGPKLMKNRKAFEIDKLIIWYNIFQIAANGYIATVVGDVLIRKFTLRCYAKDISNNPDSRTLLNAAWFYFVLKLVDFLDTIFFILKKNLRQVTFLHVYHHANMLVYAWALLKFNAGGGPILLLWTNSFVHTIMYMYYLMTVWNKEFKSNFTWKKRITEVQLIQFLSQFVYQSYSLAIGCIIPINLYYYTGPQTVIFSILFGHFYITHYLTKKSKRKVEECPSGKESSKIE